MSGVFGGLRDRFFGRGRHAITVPSLDGALRPNTALEAAEALTAAPEPANLIAADGMLWFTSGPQILRLHAGKSEVVETRGAPITAMARLADGVLYTAGLDGNLQIDRNSRGLPDGIARSCVTGLVPEAHGSCLLTIGSDQNAADSWAKDLLEGHATGSLWRISPAGEARCLAKGLAWPERPVALADGSIILSESSGARVLRFDNQGRRSVVLADLPGYPAGIAVLDHGYALCLKAPRNQLIEFILREPQFCAQMIRSMPQASWIAPSLYPPRSFLEPLQGGALKQLGIMKPWAPSRSQGLVILLDQSFVPVRSFHSRADGRRHGTVACAPLPDGLAVASWGAGEILRLTLGGATP